MPRLRRFNGKQIVAILELFGFELSHIRGSHHIMQRVVNGQNQSITVPVHGSKVLQIKTLKSIYRQACEYIPEDELRPHFYGD